MYKKKMIKKVGIKMERYVITITGMGKGSNGIRTLKTTFADCKEAVNYVNNKYIRAKPQLMTSEERRHGVVYKSIYKICGENNRISIYTIKIHKVSIKGDDCYEEKKDS